MAHSLNKLSSTKVAQVKIDVGQRKLFDGGGLYLLVQASGAKYWRMAYRFASKEKTLAFGGYPEVSLKEAREKRNNARKLLAEGIVS